MLYAPKHIDDIENHIKTETRRLWSRWHVKVGGIYACQRKRCQPNAECDAWIRVTGRYTQFLGEMTEENAKAEGGYTLEQFKKIWPKYSGKEWDDNELVYVIEFEYVGKNDPRNL